jgi:hypothetical protein
MRRAAGVIAVVAGLVAGLAGCATARQTDPPMTATEQMLISTAIDRAAEQLKLDFAPGRKVFVDAQYVDFEPSQIIYPKYTVAAVRNRLLRLGAELTADRAAADVIVEVRSGAQSIDDKKALVGLPGFSVPVPLAGALTVPEVPIFRRMQETGHAKLAVVAYDKDGVLIGDSGLQYGKAIDVHWSFLFVFSYTSHDLYPQEE